MQEGDQCREEVSTVLVFQRMVILLNTVNGYFCRLRRQKNTSTYQISNAALSLCCKVFILAKLKSGEIKITLQFAIDNPI